MLKRIPMFLLLLVVAGGVAFLFHHNGHPVTLHLGEKSPIELPLAAHLLLALSLGAGVVLLAFAARGLVQGFWGWRDRRRRKRAADIDRIRQEGRRQLWGGDFRRAGKKLARAAQKEPEDLETQLAHARSLQELDDLAGAQRVLEMARAHHGPQPRLLSRLGNLALERGNVGAAIDAFREAVSAQPQSPRLCSELIRALAAEGKFDEAVEVAQRRFSLEKQPTRRDQARQEWLTLRYRAAVTQVDPELARTELRRLLAEAPSFAPVVVESAARARADGDVRTADRLYREALSREPSGVVLERFATMHTGSGEADRALPALRDACAKSRKMGPRLALCRCLIAADKLDEAEEALAEISRASTAKTQERVDFAPERDLIAGELALARGNDREAARLLLRAATASRIPFSYSCSICGRTARAWTPACDCGEYGSYDWIVNSRR